MTMAWASLKFPAPSTGSMLEQPGQRGPDDRHGKHKKSRQRDHEQSQTCPSTKKDQEQTQHRQQQQVEGREQCRAQGFERDEIHQNPCSFMKSASGTDVEKQNGFSEFTVQRNILPDPTISFPHGDEGDFFSFNKGLRSKRCDFEGDLR